MAFVNTDPAQATSLVAHMQKLVNENEGLRAFAVFVAGPEVKPAIEEIASKNNISIPMVFLPQGKQDPALSRYKVNLEAKTTVTVSRGNRILGNWVNVGPDAFPTIATEAKKMLVQ